MVAYERHELLEEEEEEEAYEYHEVPEAAYERREVLLASSELDGGQELRRMLRLLHAASVVEMAHVG